eukprot:2533953-Rhodomonas_salina.2
MPGTNGTEKAVSCIGFRGGQHTTEYRTTTAPLCDTPKSNARNRMPGTNSTGKAVSCVWFLLCGSPLQTQIQETAFPVQTVRNLRFLVLDFGVQYRAAWGLGVPVGCQRCAALALVLRNQIQETASLVRSVPGAACVR